MRLKKFNLEISKLVDVYKKEIRVHLEYAVPVWHSSITLNQSNQIERVQKQAFRIILEHNYISYDVACTLLFMQPLYCRRIQLCINFVKRDLKKDNILFTRASKTIQTRSFPNQVEEYRCRTERYQKSSMPYLAKLLNNQRCSCQLKM